MTDLDDLIKRLREGVIADAFRDRTLIDGVLVERLIRERHEAADTIERLKAALEPFAKAGTMEILEHGMAKVLLFTEDIDRARRALKGET